MVARIRTSLKDKGLKKEPGCSSIEVDGVVHEFLVGDMSHPRSREMYVMLEEMDEKLELAGHVPDTSAVLYDTEEEWKREGSVSSTQREARDRAWTDQYSSRNHPTDSKEPSRLW